MADQEYQNFSRGQKRKAADAFQERSAWKCAFCIFSTLFFGVLLSHMNATHSEEKNFDLVCGLDGCTKSYTKYNGLYTHLRRHHSNWFEKDSESMPPPPYDVLSRSARPALIDESLNSCEDRDENPKNTADGLAPGASCSFCDTYQEQGQGQQDSNCDGQGNANNYSTTVDCGNEDSANRDSEEEEDLGGNLLKDSAASILLRYCQVPK